MDKNSKRAENQRPEPQQRGEDSGGGGGRRALHLGHRGTGLGTREPADFSNHLLPRVGFREHEAGQRNRQHEERRDRHCGIESQRGAEPGDIVGNKRLRRLRQYPAGPFQDADLLHCCGRGAFTPGWKLSLGLGGGLDRHDG